VCVCEIDRESRESREGGDRRERERKRERVQTPKDIYLNHGDDS